MVNFLLISGIGPTTRFFGCLPLRIGIFVIFLLQTGILIGSLFEHLRWMSEGGGILNEWVAFSIQIVIAWLVVMDLVVIHPWLSMVTYFVLLAETVGIACDKFAKINYVYNNTKYWGTVTKLSSLPLAQGDMTAIFTIRCFAEIMLFFYFSYIAYSYSQVQSRESDKKN